MHRSRLEMLVGFFVILGLILLTFMVFFISGVYVFKRGYHLNVLFNFVSNLDKGASVRLSGIPIGNVKELGLRYDESLKKHVVKTKIFVHEGVIIRENSAIRIEGVYGLSTPHIEIHPGESPDAPVLKDGDTVMGVDPASMDELVARGNKIAEHLEETIVRINHFISDPEVNTSLRGTLINMNSLTGSINKMLSDKQGNLMQTIVELEQASLHLKNILDKIDKGQGTAGKLISDEALYNELEAFVKDLKAHPWKLLKKDSGKGGKFLGIF